MLEKCPWCDGSEIAESQIQGYGECAKCLSLVQVQPHEPASIYDSTYYTHQIEHRLKWGKARRAAENFRAALAATNLWFGKVPPYLRDLIRVDAFDRGNKTLLDYGCGSGMYTDLANVYGLKAVGFDPFTPGHDDESVLNAKYDVLLLRHVLEHLSDPLQPLRQLRANIALIYLPIWRSPQAQRSGPEWEAVTCKGHETVPTVHGAVCGISRAGWVVDEVWWDFNVTANWVDGSSVAFRARPRS